MRSTDGRHGLAPLGSWKKAPSSPGASEHDTVWIITRHDSGRPIVEFTRFTHRLASGVRLAKHGG